MTDPTVHASSVNVPADLSTLKLAELQQLATDLGVAGVSKLRKGELVDAITQTQTAGAADAPAADDVVAVTDVPAEPAAAEPAPADADAPAPTAMHRIAVKPSIGWIDPGAASRPQSAVNTTSDITRGLVSAQKSRQSAGRLMSVVTLVILSFPKSRPTD